LAGGGRQFSTQRGKLALFAAAPLLVLQFSDFGEGDFAGPVLAAFDEIVAAKHKAELFYEMGRMNNYDSALRTRMTSHFAEHRPQIASLHVFTRSRIVAMGVSVANLALGQLITVHTDSSRFFKAIDVTAKKHRVVGISGTLLSVS
jgi:hypothetical protein